MVELPILGRCSDAPRSTERSRRSLPHFTWRRLHLRRVIGAVTTKLGLTAACRRNTIAQQPTIKPSSKE